MVLGDGVVANVVLHRTKGHNAGWIVITAGWAFAVTVAVYCVNSVSGAHLTPAVTIALASIGTFAWSKVPMYIAAQIVGGFPGGAIVWLAYLPHWSATPDRRAGSASSPPRRRSVRAVRISCPKIIGRRRRRRLDAQVAATRREEGTHDRRATALSRRARLSASRAASAPGERVAQAGEPDRVGRVVEVHGFDRFRGFLRGNRAAGDLLRFLAGHRCRRQVVERLVIRLSIRLVCHGALGACRAVGVNVPASSVDTCSIQAGRGRDNDLDHTAVSAEMYRVLPDYFLRGAEIAAISADEAVDHQLQHAGRLIPADRRDDHDAMRRDPPRVELIHPVVHLPHRVVRRRRSPSSQIVVVNALNHNEVCRALDAGADDALTATTRCFDSRINALARRAHTLNAGARVAIGDVVFDRESRRVWCAGNEVRMTTQECAVLDCFFWHDPEPVGLRTLTDFVWHGCASRDVVEVYVGYVRRKLATSKHVLLQTIRGRGYHFVHRTASYSA